GRVPARCRGAGVVFRRRGADTCRARGRAPRTDLDTGLQPVRRPARGGAGPALRLRLAFRADADDGRDRRLPFALPAFALPGQTLRHAGLQRGGGRYRRGSALPGVVLAAVVRQSALGPPGTPATAGGKLRRIAVAPEPPGARPGAVVLRDRL